MKLQWVDPKTLKGREFTCGVCKNFVASNLGFEAFDPALGAHDIRATAHICPFCSNLNVNSPDGKWPSIMSGNTVAHVPENIEELYNEARRSEGAGAYTASVLTCRKLLMNIAVNKGAIEGQTFVTYVEFLSDKGYVPPDGKHWVDHIRKRGNEANHEIALMRKEDSSELISFSEMLLKLVFEFPARVPKPKPSLASP